MRPLVLSREIEHLHIDVSAPKRLICMSQRVLGHGVLSDIRDIIVVDIDRFDRTRSLEVAGGNRLQYQAGRRRPALSPDRGWEMGFADPWLGIPVKWDQISGARVIIEAGFKDLEVDPSQGSHFFQNITSFRVCYFSVNTSATKVSWTGSGFAHNPRWKKQPSYATSDSPVRWL